MMLTAALHVLNTPGEGHWPKHWIDFTAVF